MIGKIETGVPLPPKRKGESASLPFAKMTVGDSFFVRIDHLTNRGTTYKQSSLLAAANHAAKSIEGGAKFKVRKTDGGFRCWRVA